MKLFWIFAFFFLQHYRASGYTESTETTDEESDEFEYFGFDDEQFGLFESTEEYTDDFMDCWGGHADCRSDEYCDRNFYCDSCDNCNIYNDAFDYECSSCEDPDPGPEIIHCGETVSGIIADDAKYEAHLFHVTLSESSHLNVSIVSAEFDWTLWLFDESVVVDIESCFYPCSTLTTRFPIPAGTYVIAIQDWGRSFDRNFVFSLDCQPQEIHIPEASGTLRCGDEISGSTYGRENFIGNPAPDSYYRFDVTDKYFLFSTCGSDFDTTISLHWKYWVEFERWDDSESCELQTITDVMYAEAPGTLSDIFVLIEGYGISEGNYTLSVRCFDEDDAIYGECNSHDDCNVHEFCNMNLECSSCEACAEFDSYNGICPCDDDLIRFEDEEGEEGYNYVECIDHFDCDENEYCDSQHNCFSCNYCNYYNDSIDWSCSTCDDPGSGPTVIECGQTFEESTVHLKSLGDDESYEKSAIFTFELIDPQFVSLSTCESELSDVYIKLYDNMSNKIETSFRSETCEGYRGAIKEILLLPGNYIIVIETDEDYNHPGKFELQMQCSDVEHIPALSCGDTASGIMEPNKRNYFSLKVLDAQNVSISTCASTKTNRDLKLFGGPLLEVKETYSCSLELELGRGQYFLEIEEYHPRDDEDEFYKLEFACNGAAQVSQTLACGEKIFGDIELGERLYFGILVPEYHDITISLLGSLVDLEYDIFDKFWHKKFSPYWNGRTTDLESGRYILQFESDMDEEFHESNLFKIELICGANTMEDECTSAVDCGEDLYCDENNRCFTCEACEMFHDSIDDLCCVSVPAPSLASPIVPVPSIGMSPQINDIEHFEYLEQEGEEFVSLTCNSANTRHSWRETFSLEISELQSVTVSTCGSAFDTTVLLFDDEFIFIDSCDNCGTCGEQAELDVELETGIYFIEVDGTHNCEDERFIKLEIICDEPKDTTQWPILPPPICSRHSDCAEISDTYCDEFQNCFDCEFCLLIEVDGIDDTCGTCQRESLIQSVDVISCEGSSRGQIDTSKSNFIKLQTQEANYVTVSSCGSSFDTILSIYNSSWDLISSCDDCGNCGTQTMFTTLLEAGEHFIKISDFNKPKNSDWETYEIEVTCDGDTGPHSESPGCGDTIFGEFIAYKQNLIEIQLDTRQAVSLAFCNVDYLNTNFIFEDSSWKLIYRCTSSFFCDDCSNKIEYSAVLDAGNHFVEVVNYDPTEVRVSYELTLICEDIQNIEHLSCGDTISSALSNYQPTIFQIEVQNVNQITAFRFCNHVTRYDTEIIFHDSDVWSSHMRRTNIEGITDECAEELISTALLGPGSYIVEVHHTETDLATFDVFVDCEDAEIEPVKQLSCGDSVSGVYSKYISETHMFDISIQETEEQFVTFIFCNEVDRYSTYFNFGDVSWTRTDRCTYSCTDGCQEKFTYVATLNPGHHHIEVSSSADSGILVTYNAELFCEDKQVISMDWLNVTCGSVITGRTTDALNTIGNNSPEQIFTFVIDDPGDVVFSTCDSNFDTYVRIYDERLIEICGCDDCGDCGTQAKLSCSLDVGIYSVVVEGYSNASGDFVLEVNCEFDK